MKNLNNFLASEQSVSILSTTDLVAVRGGENPPERPSDPFKTLGFWRSFFASWFGW